MADADIERVLWIWTGAEVFVLAGLLWLLWGSVFADTGFLSTVARPIRLAALVFVVIQLLIPAAVFLDLRLDGADPGYMWVHVAAMPVVNVVGLLGYLEERRRRRDG